MPDASAVVMPSAEPMFIVAPDDNIKDEVKAPRISLVPNVIVPPFNTVNVWAAFKEKLLDNRAIAPELIDQPFLLKTEPVEPEVTHVYKFASFSNVLEASNEPEETVTLSMLNFP